MARFGRWQMGMGIVWAMALCLGCKNTPQEAPPETTPKVSEASPVASEVSDASSDAQANLPAATQVKQSPRVYPKDFAFGGDLDIIVVQQRKALVLNNRTTHTYENMELWVNQRYATQIDHIGIGQGTSVALTSLINRYGESYPVPGFLRPDRSFPALLVEMIDPKQSKRFRLHVRSKP